MTKVRENNYGIIFLDHQKFPFFKAIERKAEGGGKRSFSIWNIPQMLFYFILFYFIFGKHKGRPDWTSHWHPPKSSQAHWQRTDKEFHQFHSIGFEPRVTECVGKPLNIQACVQFLLTLNF